MTIGELDTISELKQCHCQNKFHDSAFPSMCCTAAKRRGDICPKCSPDEVVYVPTGGEFDTLDRKNMIYPSVHFPLFTKREIQQIKHYIDMNKESYTYYGNKDHFMSRERSIIAKMEVLIKYCPDL